MPIPSNCAIREASIVTLSLLSWQFAGLPADANPAGGVVAQGSANFSGGAGSETITTGSANTFINWNSFNIGTGETTTFVEPTATSVVWNNIDGSGGASQILGNLNANGYVILQNSSGFFVGGNAAITAPGLIMTTAAVRPPSLSSGGAWDFNAPPPTAQILNYGKINITGGGSAFLIASDIVNENGGQITAEGGKIGLYAGEKVLVSMSPDGRGLSAQVTLPQGSVDNEGRLIADGGTIAAAAQTVNQNGLAQANGVQNVNGVIELVASDNLTVGASSDIEANGDASVGSASPGGFVVLQSGNTYSDTPTSQVNVSGQNGGQNGIVEIMGNGAVQSAIGSTFATLINPFDITLSDNPTDLTDDPTSPNFNIADLSNYGQIDLHALDTIELSAYWLLNDPGAPGSLTLSAGNNILVDPGAGIDTTIDPANYWNINLAAGTSFVPTSGQLAPASGTDGITFDGTLNMANGNASLSAANSIEIGSPLALGDSAAPSSLSLQAGNSVILDDGAGIAVGNNWNIDMVAGAGFDPATAQSAPASGTDGIYLQGSASIQTQNGDINLWAANEVILATTGFDVAGYGGIRTLNGGNITMDAEFGNVNTGSNPVGYVYDPDQSGDTAPPYYSVTPDTGSADLLGGISTAAGGNVTINAGGNVTSYLPTGNSSVSMSADDGGTGAYGPEAGNVTITAGGSVYGNYVLANGVGSITAGQNAGAAAGHPFSLSLIDGGWTVNAPNGNIYLREVLNPNGVFNNLGNASDPGYHYFDYGADASVALNAYGVFLTGLNVPRPSGNVPVLYAPILDITAGAGGVTLEGNVTLFPSPDQSLDIVTTDGGDLVGQAQSAVSGTIDLYMSDSGRSQWIGTSSFGINDHGSSPEDLNDPNPVSITVSGDMENLNLITSKATQITVDGDMVNCGFAGQNLSAKDTTSIDVLGQIYNQSAYAFVDGINIPAIPVADLPPGYVSSWDNIFSLAVDPTAIANLPAPPPGLSSSQWLKYALGGATVFGENSVKGLDVGVNPGFVYNAATGQLGFGGPMNQTIFQALSGPITVLHLVNGLPVLDSTGHFETDTINWAPASVIQTLFTSSQADPSPSVGQLGYRIGEPGTFDVTAGSISLGNSYGILSCGVADPPGGFGRYGNLASLTPEGATLDVTVDGDLTMQTSTIAAIGGGDVNVTSLDGSMDLGSPGLFNQGRQVGYGVFSSGGGDVNVVAQDDVDVDGSRIASYNGGNILVESLTGNVNVGTGGDTQTGVFFDYVDPTTGKASLYPEYVFGSGIVANTLVPAPPHGLFPPSSLLSAVPGNITVETPEGDITASLGGITQEALNGTTTPGPVINLVAGTPAGNGSPGYTGNIDLGQSGVIGGAVNATANGNITGLIISRQNSDVNAAQNFNGSVLAGGTADVSGGGTVSGVIVGVGGASVSGGSVTAEVLSQNASVNGGSSTSTLGASATATSTSQSAAQQSSSDSKQLASADNGSDDDKKKKKNQPLMQRVKRVTVILPKTS